MRVKNFQLTDVLELSMMDNATLLKIINN